MNYNNIWKKVLSNDEKVEYEFSIGKKYLIVGYAISLIVISVMMCVEIYSATMLLLLVSFYFLFYAKRANAYALTNKRILIHYGWLSTSLTSVDYSKITDIIVGEPFFERIIANTGYLSINTAGTSQEEIVLTHIDNPYEVKKKIDSLKDKVVQK